MRRLRQFVPAVIAGFLLLSGCVEPVKLEVVPSLESSTLQHDVRCTTPDEHARCLTEGQPIHRFEVGQSESVLWARQSPGGNVVIAAVAPNPPEKGKPARPLLVSFVAFDTTDGNELWRVNLARTARVEADEIHFIDDEKLAIVTSPVVGHGNTLIMLDARSGRELWRSPSATAKPAEPAHMVLPVPEKGAVVVGSTSVRVLDAGSGQTIATRPSYHPGLNARVTGSMPFVSGDDLFIYDYGLLRYSFAKQSFDWGAKFCTFAEDDYVGANIGLTVASALLGGGPSSIPPDYLVGRLSEPVIEGDRILVAALGLVHCLNAKDGKLLWTQNLDVPQVANIAVRDGRAYVLAGGHYVFWHGRQGMTVRQPVRFGLYCLDLETGDPVPAFQSPFHPNKTAGKMSPAEVAAWDEGDAFEEEEEWGDLKKTAPGATPPATVVKAKPDEAFTNTKLLGMAMSDAGIIVASEAGVSLHDLDGREVRRFDLPELGKPIGITSANDAILVRGTGGIAALDKATAETRWVREVQESSIEPAFGYVPMVRTLPWKRFRETEAAHFGSQLFWVHGDQLIVASGEELEGLHVSTGESIWRLLASGQVHLDPRSSTLTIIDGGVAEIYRLP